MQTESRKHRKIGAGRTALLAVPALLVAAFDLWSKWFAFEKIEPGEHVEVIAGFFYFALSRNQGGVFGVLQGRVLFFTVFSALAVCFIFWMFWTQGGESRLLTVALGLVLGGAIGNLYDRAALQYVRDFIDIRLWGWRYPTFNVADSAICAGVAILVVLTLAWKPETSENADGKPDSIEG